jgi:hypothetical protein
MDPRAAASKAGSCGQAEWLETVVPSRFIALESTGIEAFALW